MVHSIGFLACLSAMVSDSLELDGSFTTFGLATTDAERTREFYENVLGLQLSFDDGMALVYKLNDRATLRVNRVDTYVALPFSSLGWWVTDITEKLDKLKAAGVTIERYPRLDQDEQGIWNAGGTLLAWFKDPDGSLLWLGQAPTS